MTTILVVATLDTCGACHQYNLYEHPQLKYLIKQHAQIRLVEVEGYYDDGKLTLHSDGPIHPAFRSKIKFFPSFYLFTATTWNDPNQPLSGAAMGLDIDNMIELESEYDPTTDCDYISVISYHYNFWWPEFGIYMKDDPNILGDFETSYCRKHFEHSLIMQGGRK